MLPKNYTKTSTNKREKQNGPNLTGADNGIPVRQPPRERRKADTGRSVMQTVEELPPEPRPSTGTMTPLRTQMLPFNPNQYAMQNPQQNNYPKQSELPTKTMMLPPTQMPTSLQPTQSMVPQRTQMLPVTPMVPLAASPRPSHGYSGQPYQSPQSPMNPYQQQSPPVPYPRLQSLTNPSVGAVMPVPQPLPALTAPTPIAPPPPPPPPPVVPPRHTSLEGALKKSCEKDMGTVDGAEVSEKNRRKEVITNWVQHVLSNGIEGLKKEYRDCPNGGSIRSAQVFANNPTRNRYVNIPCCDATRVKLDKDPHYYIHANVVSSVQARRFICAQAPLNGTIEEFWKMIIFSGLEYIVMLCEFVEKGKSKSAEYFPSKVGHSMRIGKLCTITKISTENLDKTLTMSTLRITKKDNPDAALTVKHIHWHNWPDHGVPDNFLSPLRLLTMFLNCTKPIVVHCSAGVGRTGTLVLILIIMETFRSPNFVCVPRLFAKLREERFKSIQTEMQYLYVHRCIIEYLVRKNYTFSREDYTKFVKDYKAAEKSAA